MDVTFSLHLVVYFSIIILFALAVLYSYFQIGPRFIHTETARYIVFGIASFIFAGFVILGYITWLYLTEQFIYVWRPPGSNLELMLTDSFFTVLIGVSVGIFTTMLAILKKKEFIEV